MGNLGNFRDGVHRKGAGVKKNRGLKKPRMLSRIQRQMQRALTPKTNDKKK